MPPPANAPTAIDFSSFTTAPTPAESPDHLETLKRNLAAIATRSPRAAQRIAAAPPAPPNAAPEFIQTQDGVLSATLDNRALASKRHPLEEADRLTASIDPEKAGCVLILGFALGHHAAALARRLKNDTALIIFEPDVALLRAVFSRIDCADWLSETNAVFLTDANAPAELTESIKGLEALLALGAHILEHPPSRARLADSAPIIAEHFTRALAATRTHIITTMVQTETTLRNSLMNLDHVLAHQGVNDLRNLTPHKPAILVAAGPSLQRNIHLLEADPTIRERCVIICVQTVLEQLLKRNIIPHFVTALDYHEISKRFYENLTPESCAQTTLIVEPKANPAIIDAYPGPVRITRADELALLLGDTLTPDHAKLPPGATVAHLAYYLARFMGCDPVILTAQDLAFTDNQYYQSGAAIHRTWAPELEPFNSIESLEFQRILRFKLHLRQLPDIHDRPTYTDEQMAAYLAQFERDFLADHEAGRTTIDATEGGLAKRNTTALPLKNALETFAPPTADPLPEIPLPQGNENQRTTQRARDRLQKVARDARTISRHSRTTSKNLDKVSKVLQDAPAANRLIEKVHRTRDEVESLQPAWALILRLNQTGALKRFRADRALRLQDNPTELDAQRHRIERDSSNVTWTADVADALAELLTAADAALAGKPKRTRDITPPPSDAPISPSSRKQTITAVIPLEPCALHMRPLDAAALTKTLNQLAQSKLVSRAILLAPSTLTLPDIQPHPALSLEIHRADPMPEPAARSISAARAFARRAWRAGSGLSYLTCFDHLLNSSALRALAEQHNLPALLLVDPNSPNLDPQLTDEITTRHFENPDLNPLTFTHARPSLAPLCISAAVLEDLDQAQTNNALFAHIGGMLGYIPSRPRTDPIASSACIQIDAPTRNDDPASLPSSSPEHILLQLCAPDAHIETTLALNIIHSCAQLPDPPALTLTAGGEGGGDALAHPDIIPIIRAARDANLPAIHVRSSLRPDCITDAQFTSFLENHTADIISLDLVAATEETYRAITNRDHFQTVYARAEQLIKARTITRSIPSPFVIPRITRRDEVHSELEPFFDKWLYLTASATIDPPAPDTTNRIKPITKPRHAITRDLLTRMPIDCAGSVLSCEHLCDEQSAIASLADSSIADAWRALTAHRAILLDTLPPEHPALATTW